MVKIIAKMEISDSKNKEPKCISVFSIACGLGTSAVGWHVNIIS